MSDVDDMTGAKVGYVDLNGYQQTAYIDVDHGPYGSGVHKHTDEPVWIWWGNPHREVTEPWETS